MFKTVMPIALILIAAPALAQSNEAALPAMHVSYADLDLGTAAGIAHLDRRLAGAVDAVCDAPGDRSLITLVASANCRTVARAVARTQRETAIAEARAHHDLASAR